MVTRIVHISDLHFASRDRAVARVLHDAIVQARPDVLLVTGDVADHPSISWPFGRGEWTAARAWLREVERDVEAVSGSAVTTLVLPGNHDVLISGLSGWCWIPGAAFARFFRPWRRQPVFYHPRANITFLTLDTNPRLAFFSAEGVAIASRLKQLKRAMDSHADAARIRTSTKILLMHHHPLPVPFQGADWLLQTRRVDRLLRFVAENKIDMIFHGHKHRATWSQMRIGGTSAEPFFIEVVGAGSAMKWADQDPRGHNFNLIDVAAGGARQVRQFFKHTDADRFVEAAASGAEEGLSRLIRSRFRQPYRAKRLTWTVQTDEEGDARNVLKFDNVVFNKGLDAYEILLPEDELEDGQALPYQELHIWPAAFGGRFDRRDLDDAMRTFVVFPRRPVDDDRVGFSVENYTLNAYAMNVREAAERGQADVQRDFVDLLLTDAVDELCFEAIFPQEFRFDDVRLEVLEPLDEIDVVNDALTREFAAIPAPVGNRLAVTLPQPPPNYRYRVSWALPRTSAPIAAAAEARRAQFERAFLNLVADDPSKPSEPPSPVQDAIIEAVEDVSSELERLVVETGNFGHDVTVVDERTDFSLMVCDRSAPPPRLRLVFWNRQFEHPEAFRDFRLAIGNGNAGRAYKTRTLRLFDKSEAEAVGKPKAGTYVKLHGIRHDFMFSVPLIDPRSGFPLAVLNVGTADRVQAAMFRALPPAALEQLVGAIHQAPLARLLHAAGLR